MRVAALSRSGAGVILLTCIGCGGSPRQTPRALDAAVLEVRLVLPESADHTMRAPFGGQTLYLAPEPLVSDSDFMTVRATGERDQDGRPNVTLRVECAPEADERMRSISEQHMNERMAVVVDGVVRSAPIVRMAVGCSGAYFYLRPADEVEAERIVERVRNRWPEG